MSYEEERELLNITRHNNYLLQQILFKLNNQEPFEVDVLANLFAGLFNKR